MKELLNPKSLLLATVAYFLFCFLGPAQNEVLRVAAVARRQRDGICPPKRAPESNGLLTARPGYGRSMAWANGYQPSYHQGRRGLKGNREFVIALRSRR